MTRALPVLACLLVAACAGSSVPPEAAPVPAAPAALAPPATDPGLPRPPFVLAVEAPAEVAPGGVADVTATVERSAPSTLPIELRVSAPEGLRLVDGAPAETLVDEGPTIVRRFRVEVADPAAVLEVTASAGTEGLGAFARREVRFGGETETARPQVRPGGQLVPADPR